MGLDYPDFMQNVSRAPTQNLPYQVWGASQSIGSAVAAGATASLQFNVADDGYRVVIDTIFLSWTIKGPAYASVNVCDNQHSPSWVGIAAGLFDLCAKFVVSSQGAFSLIHPNAVLVQVTNGNDVARVASMYINYYKYVV